MNGVEDTIGPQLMNDVEDTIGPQHAAELSEKKAIDFSMQG